jgi:hypothetical protein
MSNKRITDLTELTNPTTDDVFPVVDIATNTTTKVQLGNLPVQTAVTTALATKQDSLVSGTNIKTINSTSLVGSGNVAVQPTLVSGTNIKTLNSVSLLGAGDIVLAATPSGVSGAIQFSNGSAFASDAANFFWDDTNNRLGVGTNDPQTAGHFRTSGSTRGVLSVVNANDTTNYGSRVQLYNKQSGEPVVDGANGFALIYTDSTKSSFVYNYSDGPMIFGTAATERMRLNNNGGLTIKGSGSTSATTSLLVQNSAGTQLFRVDDNNRTYVGANIILLGSALSLSADVNNPQIYNTGGASLGINAPGSNGIIYGRSNSNTQEFFGFSALGSAIGSSTLTASAVLAVNSTTQGFLPPRMTTTQKNAIATPAAGLVLYDSTTNKLQCYNGSTWNDLF